MAYKSIDEQFWTDPFITQLNIKQRYFYFYLITNPHTHYSGIYYLLLSTISDETGFSVAEIKQLITFFINKSKIQYDAEYRIIWVINMAKYQLENMKNRWNKNDNRIKGIENYFKILHNCPLIQNFCQYYKELNIFYEAPPKPLLTPFAIKEKPPPSPSDNREVRNKKLEIGNKNIENRSMEEKDLSPVSEIISYLNSICKTNYKTTSRKTTDLIQMRMKEGFTVEDFRIVIEKKYKEWGSDSKMSKYLRPETLFGTKFEAYLNQVDAKNKSITDIFREIDAEEKNGKDRDTKDIIIPAHSLPLNR